MGNPEPNPSFRKQKTKSSEKKDRCRDSMEAILTNGVDNIYSFNRIILIDQISHSTIV